MRRGKERAESQLEIAHKSCRQCARQTIAGGLAIIHFPFAVVSPILVAERDIDDSITFVRRDGASRGNSTPRPPSLPPLHNQVSGGHGLLYTNELNLHLPLTLAYSQSYLPCIHRDAAPVTGSEIRM